MSSTTALQIPSKRGPSPYYTLDHASADQIDQIAHVLAMAFANTPTEPLMYAVNLSYDDVLTIAKPMVSRELQDGMVAVVLDSDSHVVGCSLCRTEKWGVGASTPSPGPVDISESVFETSPSSLLRYQKLLGEVYRDTDSQYEQYLLDIGIDTNHVCYFHALGVLPEHRGNGFAAQLSKLTIELARNAGYQAMYFGATNYFSFRIVNSLRDDEDVNLTPTVFKEISYGEIEGLRNANAIAVEWLREAGLWKDYFDEDEIAHAARRVHLDLRMESNENS